MPGEDVLRRGPIALVERVFDAFAAGDHDALVDVFDPEIEFFGPTATVLNEGKCYRGHDGIRRYLQDAEALWCKLELAPQKFREVGNHVVVLGRVRATARDGLALDTPAAWVWRVERGKVAWGCVYGDRDAMPRSLQEDSRGAAATLRAAVAPGTPAPL